MMKNFCRLAGTVAWHMTLAVGALMATVACCGPVRASVLTFEIFDSDPFFLDGNYNDPSVDPHYTTDDYGYPEGFQIAGNYGDYGHNVIATETTQVAAGTVYRYGIGAEGSTPNVTVHYGPYSIFTGGPELFRGGYGDLDGVLYQGSRHDPSNPIGNDYNSLAIALIADPDHDVQLYGFDLAGWHDGTDRTINSVTVYNGIPFPFIFPTNQIFEEFGVSIAGSDGASHTEFDFESSGGPLQANVIWILIDASNLGSDSENIGIDNIRFGQVERLVPVEFPVTFADIDAAFQAGQVPEATSLIVWLVGGGAALTWTGTRRRRLH